jgi:hypothetical protein
MSAIRRLWALCSILVVGAMSGACVPTPVNAEQPNFRVLMPSRFRGEVRAYTPDDSVGVELERSPRGFGWVGYERELTDRPHKVIFESERTRLGGLHCRDIGFRVQVRDGDGPYHWVSAKAEVEAVRGDLNRCLLLLSWSRE